MKIQYKKKQIKINLILGIVWLIFGIIQVAFDEKLKWFNFGWLVLSGVYFIIYINQKTKNYLTIENGIIKENYPFGKKINLDEIKIIKHFAGDIILKTEKKELIINTLLIDKKAIPELKSEFKKLNVEWK
ncbi:hypothetical protein [uncultured Olleya sp.]|uniref:hypothetical protein n=1 Tax=uncultured Olleya sp. TaxID=757243 RepID=UPI0025973BE0|nr:hypothetical protein [uncultured Olleya sp.]